MMPCVFVLHTQIDDVVRLYAENDPLSFLHCWKILGNEQKWNAKVQELSWPSKQAGGMNNQEVESDDDNGSPSQMPEGRDQQKKRKRNKGAAEGSTSSPAVEMMRRMSENRSRIEEKKEEHNREVIARKDEKINLQKQMLQVQMKEMDIREKESIIRERKYEARLIAAETSIMGMDLEKVPSYLKAYYIGMQHDIMRHQGFEGGPFDA
jgi:hypothetical protein